MRIKDCRTGNRFDSLVVASVSLSIIIVGQILPTVELKPNWRSEKATFPCNDLNQGRLTLTSDEWTMSTLDGVSP